MTLKDLQQGALFLWKERGLSVCWTFLCRAYNLV